MFALAGRGRAGAFRAGSVSSKVFVSIAGTQRAYGRSDESALILLNTLQVRETNGSDPNQCSFRARGFPISRHQEIIVTLGTINTLNRRFGGTILSTKEGYETSPLLPHTDVVAVDYSWQLNRVFVTGLFSGPADEILIQLIGDHAPDFSTAKIPAGLPTILISFTKERLRTCIDRIVKRIGGYWKADYRKRILVTLSTFPAETDPVTLTDALSTLKLDPSSYSVSRDSGQRITRVYFEGGGAHALTEIAPGETIIPIDSAPDYWYGDEGGLVIIGESQQIVAYTDRFEGGGGGLVGPGAQPTSLVTLTGEWGTALDNNVDYDYAYTFVTSGSNETLPSPLTSITTGAEVAFPTTPLVQLAVQSGTPIFGTGVYVYGISWEFPGSLRSRIGCLNQVLTNAATAAQINLSGIAQPGDAEATHINIWRSTLNGYPGGYAPTSLFLVATIAVGTSTYADTTVDSSLGAAGHATATAVCREVRITNIPAGQPGVVTKRRLWRTEGGGSQLKLLATINDNTTAEFEDDIADGSLGTNAPTLDTSGLTQPAGTVSAGSTTIPVAGGEFPDEGFAITGSGQVIRYTTRSASSLGGIPTAGPGSLMAALGYNTTIRACAMLRGIPASGAGAIVNTIQPNNAVNLWLVVDNLVAQAEISALLDPDDELGGLAGVIEETLTDQRVNRDEARQRATAYLDLQDDEQVTMTYRSTDRNNRSGRTVVIDLTQPEVDETLKLQDVTAMFDPPFPFFQVKAGNRRYTLEDLLRRIKETT